MSIPNPTLRCDVAGCDAAFEYNPTLEELTRNRWQVDATVREAASGQRWVHSDAGDDFCPLHVFEPDPS